MQEVQYQIAIALLIAVIIILIFVIVRLKFREERRHNKDLARIALNTENRVKQLDVALIEIENANLSDQLLAVLALIEDNDMKQISDKLFISQSTVAKHVSKLKEKLNLKKENGMTDIRVLYPFSQAAKILRNK